MDNQLTILKRDARGRVVWKWLLLSANLSRFSAQIFTNARRFCIRLKMKIAQTCWHSLDASNPKLRSTIHSQMNTRFLHMKARFLQFITCTAIVGIASCHAKDEKKTDASPAREKASSPEATGASTSAGGYLLKHCNDLVSSSFDDYLRSEEAYQQKAAAIMEDYPKAQWDAQLDAVKSAMVAEITAQKGTISNAMSPLNDAVFEPQAKPVFTVLEVRDTPGSVRVIVKT